MWHGIDPELRKDLDFVRGLVRRSHLHPSREWPLTFVEEFSSLLVVREWPGGEITAYAMDVPRDRRR
jgi:hypothetical protein